MKTIRLTMAQALVRFLDKQYVCLDGVEHRLVDSVFGIFGHGCVLGLGQAMSEEGHNIRFYQGKNEQNMALAAVAFAKQKDRLGIIPCISSIGPGALNMVTAAGCASANRIPLLLLPGDTFASRQPDPVLQQVEFGGDYGQTVNDAFRGVCRYFDRISRPEQLMSACLSAFRVLTDPADTGAVCLALPQDVQAEAYDYPARFFDKRIWSIDRRVPTADQIARVLPLLKKAKRPLAILGGGVRYSLAGDQFLALCEQLGMPFAETQAGKGTVPWDHPLNLGGMGVTGTQAANRAAAKADLVLAVGTRLSDFTTCSRWAFDDKAPVITLNIAPIDLYKMDAVPLLADARAGLSALAEALTGTVSAWGDETAKLRSDWHEIAEGYYQAHRPEGLCQTRALGIINGFMPASAIAVGSAGSLPGDMQRLWRSGERGSYHMEYGFSNMGYEINGALGVKLAAPGQEVYAFLGDGSYLMGHSEMVTAVQENLRIHICLFDNSGWGCIESLQNAQGSETFGTVFKLRNPKTGALDGPALPIDFAANARSYGLQAYTVRTEDELVKALKDGAKQTGPVLYDIKVLPGSFTPGFDSFWRVGVAEVSTQPTVQKARENMDRDIKKSRQY